MPRTVYIAGAGFSYPAGIPVQAGLLQRVRELRIVDAPAAVAETFVEAQTTALDFITTISRSDAVPPLEDAFTILDQTIAVRGFFLGYSWQELVVVRERLQRALLVVLHQACSSITAATFYQDVARVLLAQILDAEPGTSAGWITLNWDSVAEDTAFSTIREVGGDGYLDVDFGCDTTALVSASAHSPSVTQAARGLRSLEILKLHGSINWLLCPNCQTLFSGAGAHTRIVEEYFTKSPCVACSTTSGPTRNAAVLEPFLITPTFLKVFDNAHIQSTWLRAHRLLAKADEVVFLGYSLPLADFHLRTLLRKAIRPDAKITAVLTANDSPDAALPAAVRANFASTRYQEFFGDTVAIDPRGVEGYFADVFAATPPVEAEKVIREHVESRRAPR